MASGHAELAAIMSEDGLPPSQPVGLDASPELATQPLHKMLDFRPWAPGPSVCITAAANEGTPQHLLKNEVVNSVNDKMCPVLKD